MIVGMSILDYGKLLIPDLLWITSLAEHSLFKWFSNVLLTSK